MKTKVCKRCKEELDISKFYTNGRTPNGTQKYRSNCKPCEVIIARDRQQSNIIKALKVLDRTYSCEICKYDKNYAAIDFHHKNPADKDMNIRDLKSHSVDRLVLELDKCMVLCSNCHRELHNPALDKEKFLRRVIP